MGTKGRVCAADLRRMNKEDRAAAVLELKKELRQLALDEPKYGRFLDEALEIIRPMSIAELNEEYDTCGAGCLQTYYVNIRG